MTAPIFKVLKGNPSDDELAALTAVLSSLTAEANKRPAHVERNMWGRPESRLSTPTVFNPAAFSSVTYY
ncbi:acyl-CoA carboxylase subunit epsilon [Corynebacterium breve]|uniref:Acyl-CoA carboxylase subunit epsilon n=1 Tax=Corynebacterium breve TaxID=3049799 RepID=A0ABY8VGK1_9CORY|nr:acyl-CoA carboxylase subunit epsilon [Corynebacterium breve]WIM68227.1 acyl-CoA carboxylase subunit epsilon [Corynebacterium breve]